MRESIKDPKRLQDILEAIDNIFQYVGSDDMTMVTSDKMRYHAIVYNIMIIGEAAYKLSQDFVSTHPQVPWQDIADMRHHLVHGYYQVDSRIVWTVIQNELQPLRDQVASILADTYWEGWENRK